MCTAGGDRREPPVSVRLQKTIPEGLNVGGFAGGNPENTFNPSGVAASWASVRRFPSVTSGYGHLSPSGTPAP